MKNRKGGTVLNIVLIILLLFIAVILVGAIIRVREMKNTDQSSSSAEIKADTPAPKNNSFDKYDIKMISAKVGQDYKQKPCLIVEYEWYNNSEKETAFLGTFLTTLYQDGIECEKAILLDDGSQGSRKMTNIQPGYHTTVKEAFELSNTTSDPELVVKEAFSLNDYEYIRTKIDI